MKVLELIKNNLNADLINNIGDKIGDGSDGEIFSLKNEKDKLIKFSIIYVWDNKNFNSKNELQRLYNKTISNILAVKSSNEDIFCRVYDCSSSFFGSRPTVDGEQGFIAFYSILEKLDKTTEDEKKVFHTILSHEDANKNKNYTLSDVKEILNGLSYGLEFDRKKVLNFYEKIQKSKFKHLDLHPRNIMKDKVGNYKLVDLDRIKIKGE